MAFPKKGRREITIDNNVFVWTFRKKPTHNERHDDYYKIPIQHIDGGQILLADLDYTRSGYISDLVPAITPCMIEQCIIKAINEGWKFQSEGIPFYLDCSDIAFETAKMLIDRFMRKLEEVNKLKPNDHLENIINHANEMVSFGEYKIALEDSVTNLCEYNITLDKDIVQIAYNAFAIYKDDSYKSALEELEK